MQQEYQNIGRVNFISTVEHPDIRCDDDGWIFVPFYTPCKNTVVAYDDDSRIIYHYTSKNYMMYEAPNGTFCTLHQDKIYLNPILCRNDHPTTSTTIPDGVVSEWYINGIINFFHNVFQNKEFGVGTGPDSIISQSVSITPSQVQRLVSENEENKNQKSSFLQAKKIRRRVSAIPCNARSYGCSHMAKIDDSVYVKKNSEGCFIKNGGFVFLDEQLSSTASHAHFHFSIAQVSLEKGRILYKSIDPHYISFQANRILTDVPSITFFQYRLLTALNIVLNGLALITIENPTGGMSFEHNLFISPEEKTLLLKYRKNVDQHASEIASIYNAFTRRALGEKIFSWSLIFAVADGEPDNEFNYDYLIRLMINYKNIW